MRNSGRSVLPSPVTPAEPTLPVTVSVNKNRCQLYGICVQEAPTVFDLGADGRLR